jgi:Domain of unknown function (DUF5655)/Domain of unknown function (DUF4287)
MASMDQAEQTMVENLARQTGRSLDEWIGIVRGDGLAKHGEIVKKLKSQHGLTHGYANLVAHKALKSDAGSADAGDLIEAMYAGDKAALRPIHDRIMGEVSNFGDDVELAPKQGYISLRRSKQFALVQPSTRTRVDVGLVLRGEPPAGRLETSGSFNAMVTHRVRLATPEDVDAELIGWLRRAYEGA